MSSDYSAVDTELQRFEAGDELVIDGERFTVDRVWETHAVLTPANENGSAQLNWSELNGKYLFSRHRGVDREEIDLDGGGDDAR